MIQIVKAPSILGLRPTGVELLSDALLRDGLDVFVTPQAPLLVVDDLNDRYSAQRDDSGMINAGPLHDFSLCLCKAVTAVMEHGRFPVVLGGDCSILLGALSAMNALGNYGLVALDAHADFYLPTQSLTGEAADMDIALITGRGPKFLTDINGLGPYVEDAHVIHVGQRDEEETLQYGSAQISQTSIIRYGLDTIHSIGIEMVTNQILSDIISSSVDGFWLHLDTDVIHDEENPAVDYRLPDGLRFSECEYLLSMLIKSNYIKGLSVSIYNPNLDTDGLAGKGITRMLQKSLS